jgi:hypothetical protein
MSAMTTERAEWELQQRNCGCELGYCRKVKLSECLSEAEREWLFDVLEYQRLVYGRALNRLRSEEQPLYRRLSVERSHIIKAKKSIWGDGFEALYSDLHPFGGPSIACWLGEKVADLMEKAKQRYHALSRGRAPQCAEALADNPIDDVAWGMELEKRRRAKFKAQFDRRKQSPGLHRPPDDPPMDGKAGAGVQSALEA